jgi:hypothetical protein
MSVASVESGVLEAASLHGKVAFIFVERTPKIDATRQGVS